MGTQIYDAYASIPSSASRAREAYATSFQSSGNFQTRQMMAQDPNHNHQPENPVARFLLEESSWDPLMGRQHSALLNMGPLSEYTTYRNTTAPSEADTVGPVTMVSDSGYGSMPRQSVGIPSVYGDMDQCAETQSLIRGVSDFQFHGLSPGSATPPKEEPEGNAWSHHEATGNPDSNDLVCPTCKALVKTKSEIKYALSPSPSLMYVQASCSQQISGNMSSAIRNLIAVIWRSALAMETDSVLLTTSPATSRQSTRWAGSNIGATGGHVR